MSRLVASVALLALLAVGRGAGAAEATGWITLLDQEADQIVLDDGRIFAVSEEINFSSLKDGVKVRIHYDAIDGEKIATEILLAPQAPKAGKMVPLCAREQKEHLTKRSPISTITMC